MATMPVLFWGICLTSQLKPLAQFNRRQTGVDKRRKLLSRSRRFNLNEVFDAVASLFRPESGRDILKAIADTHAPSQTVHYTRATAVLRPSMKAFVPGVAGIKGHARGSLASSYP